MIRLDVRDYCQGCFDFAADVESPIKFDVNEFPKTMSQFPDNDTIVRCVYRKRCENIMRYLERQELLRRNSHEPESTG